MTNTRTSHTAFGRLNALLDAYRQQHRDQKRWLKYWTSKGLNYHSADPLEQQQFDFEYETSQRQIKEQLDDLV